VAEPNTEEEFDMVDMPLGPCQLAASFQAVASLDMLDMDKNG